MSQEIWVKEMPDCCEECPFNNEKTYECVLLPNFAITPFLQSCPLKSIHDHDRELVAKVLEKVKKELDGDYNQYRINYILDQIQKEVEDE